MIGFMRTIELETNEVIFVVFLIERVDTEDARLVFVVNRFDINKIADVEGLAFDWRSWLDEKSNKQRGLQIEREVK